MSGVASGILSDGSVAVHTNGVLLLEMYSSVQTSGGICPICIPAAVF